MCDDDCYDIASVPRYAVLGAARDEDANSTLGDRFFDLVHLQTNTVEKQETERHMAMLNRRQPGSPVVELELGRWPAVAKSGGAEAAAVDDAQEEVPFEINRLAMFRPPSRTRLSRDRRSNTVPAQENAVVVSTCTVKLSSGGNLCPNGYTKKDSGRGAGDTKIPSPMKTSARTTRAGAPRPFRPGQIRQRSLSHEQQQQQAHRSPSVEHKTRMGLAVRQQPLVRVRASSGEPAVRRPLMGLTNPRTGGILGKGRSGDASGARLPTRGPLRVRSASTDAISGPRTDGTIGAGIKTNIAQRQRMVNPRTANGRGTNGISKATAARPSPYKGPETRARAKMKQECERGRKLPDVVSSSNSTRNTPLRETPVKQPNIRPLSQLNPNLLPPPVPRIAAKKEVAGTGHISRPRTRTTHGPIRVQNVQRGVIGPDGLAPVGTESRFRQSVTRRPKGGASLERDVSRDSSKENARTEASNAAARKPKVPLEFAPCLRNRAAQKKTQSNTKATVASSKTAVPSGHPNVGGGGDAPLVRPRRTAAEREAFFRRLSTPKTVANVKKGTK